MSANDHPGGPGEHDEDFLAAEYVLGVLDAEGRRQAEARLASDPTFAREVAAFESSLAPLVDEVAEVTPPAAVWARVSATLAPPVARHGVAAPSPAGMWQSLAFWRGLSAGAVGLAAASLIAIAVIATRPGPQPAMPLVASLAPQSGNGHVMVTVDRSHGMIMVMPVSMAMPAPRVPELWLIPPGGAPRSLGVVDAQKPMKVKISAALMPDMTPRATLAISSEPQGGSPTGQPTGPVVATGQLYLL